MKKDKPYITLIRTSYGNYVPEINIAYSNLWITIGSNRRQHYFFTRKCLGVSFAKRIAKELNIEYREGE